MNECKETKDDQAGNLPSPNNQRRRSGMTPERLEEILEKTATGTLAHLRRMNSDPEYREALAKKVY